MRVTHVRFAMLRKTEQFENDRAEAEVEDCLGESVEEAYALAQKACVQGLKQSAELEMSGATDPRELDARLRTWIGSTNYAVKAARSARVREATELLVKIMIVIALTWASNIDDGSKRAMMLELS